MKIKLYTHLMHAFIVTGGSKESRAQYIQDLLSSQTELIHIFAEKSSISIKQIQDLNIPLSIAARLPRIVWIEEADLMTTPSENALLKMLEEPPVNTNFYLTCSSQSSLLPTIRSRAKHIGLPTTTKTNDPSILSDLKSIMSMTAGDRLQSIIKRDRGESIIWITQIEASLKDKLHDPNLGINSIKMLGNIAKSAEYAHEALLSNCSVSLVTQNFYLTLPHTHSVK